MAELMVVRPEDGRTASTNNCPVVTKQRAFVVDKGVAATLEYELRGADGSPLDLSEYVCDDPRYASSPDEASADSAESDNAQCGQVIFRFADAVSPEYNDPSPQQVIGRSKDAENGVVRVDLPKAITDFAGLWDVAIGITDRNGNVVLVNKALLSIERGLFGNITEQLDGPPTLQEVRMQLRDTMLENSLNDLPEFSDQEIIFCLGKPLRNWNETPPPVGRATARNFRYRENWLKAVCGELFAIAATWYTRNKFEAQGAGVADNALNKSQEYGMAAQMLQQQWTQWMMVKKNQISSAQFMGSFGSGYDRG